jgi:DNA-binding transcriptional MerR regulator
MLIGDITRGAGVPRDTIRYYERLGLVQLAPRSRRSNNYKEYAEDTVERLAQIGQLKELGFTLAEIRDLLAMLGASAHPYAGLPRVSSRRCATSMSGSARCRASAPASGTCWARAAGGAAR